MRAALHVLRQLAPSWVKAKQLYRQYLDSDPYRSPRLERIVEVTATWRCLRCNATWSGTVQRCRSCGCKVLQYSEQASYSFTRMPRAVPPGYTVQDFGIDLERWVRRVAGWDVLIEFQLVMAGMSWRAVSAQRMVSRRSIKRHLELLETHYENGYEYAQSGPAIEVQYSHGVATP